MIPIYQVDSKEEGEGMTSYEKGLMVFFLVLAVTVVILLQLSNWNN